MIGLNIYKVLSFILLPFGLYLGLSSLSSLVFSLGNPALLLALTVTSCASIYIFASFIFAYKGLIQGKPCKPSLVDWIKINAFITAALCFILVLVFSTILTHKELIPQLIEQFNKTLKTTMPKNTQLVTPTMIIQSSYFAIGFAVLLLVHILFSLTYIKTRSDVFNKE